MKTISILGLLALASMAATVASGQTPILQYTFNETGTTAASTGLNPTPLTFLNAIGTSADLHSAYGLGVSGMLGDRAFDNTASTGMGIGSVGGLAGIPAGTIGTLSSFTYQCWFNVATPVTNLARLLEDTHISIEALNGGVVMHVNGKFVTAAAAWSGTGEWVFFAVSYDGTKSSNNLTFYTATKTAPVTQVGTAFTLDGGPVLQDPRASRRGAGTRSFFESKANPPRLRASAGETPAGNSAAPNERSCAYTRDISSSGSSSSSPSIASSSGATLR